MLLDGTDPFGPGDGPEGADIGRDVTLADAPVPFDAAPPTPLARIQQQTITIRRFSETPEDGPPRIDVISEGGVSLSDHQYEMLASAGTFAAFKNIVDSLDLPDTGWGDGLSNFSNTRMLYPSAAPSVPPSEDVPEATVEEFHYSRTRFRLKLDLPAPASGYRIPLRTGIFSQTVAPHIRIATYRGGRDSNHIDIELQCEAGKTEGTPVEFPPDGLYDNERHTYIPASLSTRLPSFIADGYIQLGPIPDDGLCGFKNATFEMNFGNLFGDIITENYLDVPPVLEWQRRHLNADGTFGPWTKIVTREGLPGKYFKDAHAYLDAGQEGVYQVRASMLCPDGTRLEYPFVRMRDARSIRDSRNQANPLLQAGQPDYLGVAESVEAYSVRHQALIWLGSEQYAKSKHVPIRPGYLGPSTDGDPKCNFFITHISNQAGARVPYFKRSGNPIFYYAPTVKESWFIDPEREVDLDGPGWKFQGQNARICPGRVVSTVRHCGIIDYDGSWINAGTKTVNKYPHLLLNEPVFAPFILRARTEG